MQLSQLNPYEDLDEDNPALSKVIERNIRTIFLSTFFLISRNRLGEETERRADTNNRVEQKVKLNEPGS